MSSTRLPGKVLLDLGGRPVLDRMIERVKLAKNVTETVVATTTDLSDNAIVTLCARLGTPVFRGSLPDVLDRYYQCALEHKADYVVRLTGDCPLIDPELIDEVVYGLFDPPEDFSCNRLPPPFGRTFPIGLDVEACTFQALENAWKNATEKHHREHVMPYLYETPGKFQVIQLQSDEDYGSMRWTLDTPEDLELLREVIKRLGGRNDFSWEEVLELFLTLRILYKEEFLSIYGLLAEYRLYLLD
jgi:spore coat polysaccharide biosynthesis protein SpsF